MTLSSFFLLVANHLWQSTLFVLPAAVLVLALRKAPARTRFAVWWIVAVKFVIPFSLLVTIGGLFSWRAASPMAAQSSVSAEVLEQVAQPFTSEIVWTTVSGGTNTPLAGSAGSLLKIIFVGWFSGFVVMSLRWWSKWRLARGLVRNKRRAQLTAGRELEILRQLESKIGAGKPLAMVSSASAIEPFVFGFFRPVLVWPAGLSARLANEELEAILLHELSHARRRDNLTAALQMAIEVILWFHPLVWWIGAQLVKEREKACDENVLRWGGTSHVYAEGILKVCEFCLESPLVCAAGVTGSDLKKRIEDIMRNRVVYRLSWRAASLVTAAAIAALITPIAVGMLRAEKSQLRIATAQDSFEVVSIRPSVEGSAGGGRGLRGAGGRGGGSPLLPAQCSGIIQLNPGRFGAANVTLYRLVTLAYGKHCRLSLEQDLVTGVPEWTKSERFDIQATIPEGVPNYTAQQLQDGEAPALQAMIQNLLADRFNLTLHRDMKEIPVFNLVLVKMGRITLSEDQSPPPPPLPPAGPRDPSALPPRGAFGVGVDPPAGKVRIFASSVPISTIINFYQGNVGRMVIDKTDLKGLYDIPQVELDVGPYDISPGAVTVWPEIMRQLGLRMDPTKAPAEVLAIDNVEKPSEN